MDISGEISAAVDSAVEASPGSSPATSDTTPTPTPAATSPTAAPADASGPEAQTLQSSSTDAPTIPASDKTPKREDNPAKTDTQQAEPPRDKWEPILANARTKARTEGAREAYESLGVAPTVDRAQLRSHIQMLLNDPRAYHAALGRSLGADAPQQTPPPQASSARTRPQPSLRAEDGTLAYSAEQVEQLLAMHGEDIEKRMTGQISPLQQAQNDARVEQITRQSKADAAAALADYRTWHGWAELEPFIHEDMARDGRVTPESAYARHYQAWNKTQQAKLKSDTRQEILAEMKTAPEAPATVRPGAAMPPRSTTARRPQTLDARLDAALAEAFSAS